MNSTHHSNDEFEGTGLQKAPTPALLVGVAAGSLVVGILLAQFLPFGGFLGAGREPRLEEAHDHAEHEGLWTCGMHPNVLEEEAGQCPICGMDLVPLRDEGDVAHEGPGRDSGERDMTAGDSAGGQWTCSDHAQIVETEPGTCPIDGLDLIPVETGGGSMAEMNGDREVLYYRNPHDPTVTSPVPTKDSMGMDYVPVYADEGAGTTADGGPMIRIDPAVVQTMNVRTARAERRDLARPIRTVGYLEYDEQRMVTVTTKYPGWIERVYVNYVGERVRRGQPLFEVYAPELVQTEQELLSALDFARQMQDAPEDARRRAESLVDSARQRLSYWDVGQEQIERLEQSGEVFRTVTVTATSSGVVMKRMAGLEGMAVQPGMELFHIADLSSLWVSVELFEDQLAAVRQGTEASIELSYFPGETFTGRVRFIEPEFSETTRTVRAKIEVPNRQGRLRKGMYATVDLRPIEVRDAVVVPIEAVLRTGQRNVVVVAQGEGRFRPVDVTLGLEAGGVAQVIAGLEAGTTVVTSAQFLLDSESSLREALQKMVADRANRSAGSSSQNGSR